MLAGGSYSLALLSASRESGNFGPYNLLFVNAPRGVPLLKVFEGREQRRKDPVREVAEVADGAGLEGVVPDVVPRLDRDNDPFWAPVEAPLHGNARARCARSRRRAAAPLPRSSARSSGERPAGSRLAAGQCGAERTAASSEDAPSAAR